MTRGKYGSFSGQRPAAAEPSLLFLGLCPAIAVSVRVMDALWISAGVVLVLVLSDLALWLLAREGPPGQEDRPAALLRALLITSFLTASLEALLLARAPSASASLGIYAPLVAVNCLVLGRGGASRAAPRSSIITALGRGIRFALALVLIAVVREVLGAGTITLVPMASFGGTIAVGGLVDQPVRALGLAGGALLCLGYLAGAARAITGRARRPATAGPVAGTAGDARAMESLQ